MRQVEKKGGRGSDDDADDSDAFEKDEHRDGIGREEQASKTRAYVSFGTTRRVDLQKSWGWVILRDDMDKVHSKL